MNRKLPAICTSDCQVPRKRSRSTSSSCHMPGPPPALTLEDGSVLDDKELQLHAGRLQELLHVQAGCCLVLLLHLPRAARGALRDTYLQIGPWRETQEGQKTCIRRWNCWEWRGNQLHTLVSLQLLFGQIDDISGICPEQAAWPKEKTDKAEPGSLSNSPRELAMYACQHAACFSSHTLHPLMCWCQAERYRASPCCLLHAYQHIGRELQAARRDRVGDGKSSQDLKLWIYNE